MQPNERLDWMQRLFISLKCQPPSSPHFPPPPPPDKMKNVKSMMPLPAAIWMTDLNKIGNPPQKKSCFYPAAGTLRFPSGIFLSHPLCTAVWTQREGWTPSTGGGGVMGGGWWWDKDLRDSSVNWVWRGQFYSGCGQTAAVPPSIYKVDTVLKTSELATQLRPGFTRWGEVNRAQIPL